MSPRETAGENSYTGVYPHIYEVTNLPQQNIVLLYGNSNEDTYQAIAFRIKRAIRRREEVDNGPTVGADSTLSFGYFGEDGHSADVADAGEEVFRVDSNRDRTLVEYGFGFPENGVYVGVETGEGDVVNGLGPGDDRDRGFSAADLDQRGGVLSDLTTVETQNANEAEPTTALSEKPDQGLVRIDSRENGNNPFRFAFKNITGGSITVNPIAVGMHYEVVPVIDRQQTLRMAAGRETARLLTYGGLGNSKPNLPRKWQEASYQVEYGDVQTV